MIPNEDHDLIEFNKKLAWFEKEFEFMFQHKTHNFIQEERELADMLLDKLSETINEYGNEKFIFPLVELLNKIEKRYPEFFKVYE